MPKCTLLGRLDGAGAASGRLLPPAETSTLSSLSMLPDISNSSSLDGLRDSVRENVPCDPCHSATLLWAFCCERFTPPPPPLLPPPGVHPVLLPGVLCDPVPPPPLPPPRLPPPGFQLPPLPPPDCGAAAGSNIFSKSSSFRSSASSRIDEISPAERTSAAPMPEIALTSASLPNIPILVYCCAV